MKTYNEYLKEAAPGGQSFEEGMAQYRKLLDKMEAEQKAKFTHLKDRDFKFVIKKLRKYTAIYDSEYGHIRSIHSFIDNETGALLKPAGFKAPASGPRGYITDPEFMKALASRIDPYGGYLYKR